MSHEWIRFDAPGDFQLILREDFMAIDGFDEDMLLGYHVDSNLSRRLLLHRGAIETLEDQLSGYHCNHSRTRTVYHGPRVTNDLLEILLTRWMRLRCPRTGNLGPAGGDGGGGAGRARPQRAQRDSAEQGNPDWAPSSVGRVQCPTTPDLRLRPRAPARHRYPTPVHPPTRESGT